MAGWSPLTWSAVSIGLGLALAVGCGGQEEAEHPGGVSYENEGGSTSRPRDAEPVDESCEDVGSLRECMVDIVVNGVKSCFPGHAVCQGEAGWTICMDTAEAKDLAASLEDAPEPTGTAGAGSDEGDGTAGSAGSGS